MIELQGMALPLDAGPGKASLERALASALIREFQLSSGQLRELRLLRLSVDARKRSAVHYVANAVFSLADEAAEQAFLTRFGSRKRPPRVRPHLKPPRPEPRPWDEGRLRPVVVGAGPAGLFCALVLAEAGAAPLVLERGAAVEERTRTVREFAAGGPLDLRTNIQFGEGGAGTFSDGKLTTNTKNPLIPYVLERFVEAGAPEDVLWQAHPHIGSDRLPGVVRSLRRRIESLGGQFRFCCRLTDLDFDGERLRRAVIRDELTGQEESIEVVTLVLACGHSARDSFAMLLERGLWIVPKPFSVGVRIEHLQEAINRAQWGSAASHPALGAADYKLVEHLDGGRSVYSFCMCPGGVVVAATSEEGAVVTNGMSPYARDGRNSNAALLVSVGPEDFDDEDPLAGVRFQQAIEQAAFRVGRGDDEGKAFRAPAQTVGALLGTGPNRARTVTPSYPRSVRWVELDQVFPPFVMTAIAEALPKLDRKLHGFAHPDAVMSAPETRSSSPVRILRGSDLQAFLKPPASLQADPAQARALPGKTGLYPCGEGAGYAGGIMSAAIDGIRVAQRICDD